MNEQPDQTTEAPSEDEKLDLRGVIVIETREGEELSFEVVGLVDDDQGNSYAVCYCEPADEFIVTSSNGELLEDEELAQEILDDFFVLAEESAEEA
jgi:hypothetical protein